MIVSLLSAAGSTVLLQAVAIIVCTLILEDATSVLVGTLASAGQLSWAPALASLWAGIALGDLGLYGLGRLAARHRWARAFVATSRAERAKEFLHHSLFATVSVVRFVPGLRLPVYTACGLLGLSFRRFAAAVVLATALWTTLVFAAAFFGAGWTEKYFAGARWLFAVALVLSFVAAGRLARRRWFG